MKDSSWCLVPKCNYQNSDFDVKPYRFINTKVTFHDNLHNVVKGLCSCLHW